MFKGNATLLPVPSRHAPNSCCGNAHLPSASGDGAHPDAAGYEELAQLVQSWSAWFNCFNLV